MYPRFIHRSESGPGASHCCSSWVMTRVCLLYFTVGCWSHLPLPKVTVTGRAICLLTNLSGSHERGDWRLACGTHTHCQLTGMAHSSLPYGATTYVQREGERPASPFTFILILHCSTGWVLQKIRCWFESGDIMHEPGCDWMNACFKLLSF